LPHHSETIVARIEIYTTPFCGYCARAKALLDSKGVSYEERDVMMDDKARAEMRARTRRTSVPQIFIDGQHIGGSDELAALEAEGKLDPLLAGKP
jgi:glutaredoxin 3